MLDARARRRQRVRNRVQGLLLLSGSVATLALVAWLVLGPRGLFWVVGLGVVLVATRPRVPTSWILSMYGARRLPPEAAPELHHIVAVLSRRAGLPALPRLYYVPSPMANAFAVGEGDDAALAVTDGLLRGLTGRQVAGVLAHEIAHIRAGDTAVMSLSDSVGRLVQGLSYVGMMTLALTVPLTVRGDVRPLLVSLVLAASPTVVTLLQLGLSRAREYDADLEAVGLTGDVEGLVSALEALERAEGRAWERVMVPHGRSSDPLLLRTHPATGDRARRLRELVATSPPKRRESQLGHHAPVPPRGYPVVPHPPRLRRPGIRW